MDAISIHVKLNYMSRQVCEFMNDLWDVTTLVSRKVCEFMNDLWDVTSLVCRWIMCAR